MKISIDKIIVEKRIRKEINRIEELAADIQENGLLQPIIVMPLEGGELRLLAGLRRLRAAQSMDWTEIEANVVTPADAEAALRIEISENEQRVGFTPTEQYNYGVLLLEVQKQKALERKVILGKAAAEAQHGRVADPGPLPTKQEAREVVGEALGMSGRQWDRLKYVVENAPPEVLDAVNSGERKVRQAYDDLRADRKFETTPSHNHPAAPAADCSADKTETEAAPPDVPFNYVSSEPPKFEPPKQTKLSDKAKEERAMAMLSPEERAAIERNNAFAAMSPEQKIADLQAQLKAERSRAVAAESELSRLRDELHNAVYHRDGIIKNMERQLAAAEARVRELEEKYEQDKRE